jgi:MFS family permease
MRPYYNPALLRFLAGFFLQSVAGTIVLPLLTLTMAADGVSALLIGALATVGSLAYMAALPAAPALIARFGDREVFRAAAVASALSWSGLAVSGWPPLWALLFACSGAAAGLRYTIAESWVPALVAPEQRGRAMALFQTCIGAAFFAGSGALLLLGVAGPWPRALTIGAALLATLVLWPVRGPAAGAVAAPAGRGLRAALVQVGPLVLGAALLGGLFESGLSVALPLYGLSFGLSPALAAGLVTAIGLGSLAQYPFGYLADRRPWAQVVFGAASLIALSALLLPLASGQPALLMLLGVLWGSAGGGLYTLATIRNGELWRGQQLVGASVITQFAYMLGDAAGPTLGGLALDAAPLLGLPVLVGGAGVSVIALMLWFERKARGTAAKAQSRA